MKNLTGYDGAEHTFNLSTQETESQGQPGLQSKSQDR